MNTLHTKEIEKLERVFSQLYTLDDMVRRGFSRHYVFKALADKRAVSLRRGIYMSTETWMQLSPWERYAAAAYAYALRSKNPIFSHQTSAMFHGLWLVNSPPEKLHIYAPARSRGTSLGVVKHPFLTDGTETFLTPLGVRTTSLIQTVIDCARTMPLLEALCLADSALHLKKVAPEDLWLALTSYEGRRSQQVHQLAELASALAESPGESGTRLLLHELGIEFIEQYEIFTPSGRYRVDFFLPELNIIVEFDGRVKYTVFGERTQVEALERQREKELQNLGYVVYRTDWSGVFYNPRKFKGELLHLAQKH